MGACPVVPTLLLLRADEDRAQVRLRARAGGRTHPLTRPRAPTLTTTQRPPAEADLVPLPYVYAPEAEAAVSRHYEALVEDALKRFG